MKCRQNWSEACETKLNNQINSEYEASLVIIVWQIILIGMMLD